MVHFVVNDRMAAAKRHAAARAVAQLDVRETEIGELLHELTMLPAESAEARGKNADRDEEPFEEKVVFRSEELVAVITVRKAAHAVERSAGDDEKRNQRMEGHG